MYAKLSDSGATVIPDPPPTTPTEAEVLMLHHLELAAMYFEVTETTAQLLKARATERMNPYAAAAAHVFIDAIEAEYAELP